MDEASFAMQALILRDRAQWEELLRLYYRVWLPDPAQGNKLADRYELWPEAYWVWVRQDEQVHERIYQECKQRYENGRT